MPMPIPHAITIIPHLLPLSLLLLFSIKALPLHSTTASSRTHNRKIAYGIIAGYGFVCGDDTMLCWNLGMRNTILPGVAAVSLVCGYAVIVENRMQRRELDETLKVKNGNGQSMETEALYAIAEERHAKLHDIAMLFGGLGFAGLFSWIFSFAWASGGRVQKQPYYVVDRLREGRLTGSDWIVFMGIAVGCWKGVRMVVGERVMSMVRGWGLRSFVAGVLEWF